MKAVKLAKPCSRVTKTAIGSQRAAGESRCASVEMPACDVCELYDLFRKSQ